MWIIDYTPFGMIKFMLVYLWISYNYADCIQYATVLYGVRFLSVTSQGFILATLNCSEVI